MTTRFLVLIDFSPYSKDQLLLAHQWSKLIQAELLLIHQLSVYAPAFADMDSRIEIASHEKQLALKQLQEFASETLGEIPSLRYHVSEESLLLLLPKLMHEGYNDLIFAGLKGTGILKKLFIGSTTIKIIDNINQTVVAVPKDLTDHAPETFYVAVSHKYPLNLQAFDKLLSLFSKQIKNIKFISILSSKDQHDMYTAYLESLTRAYADKKNASYEAYESEDAFAELKAFMKKQEDGVLVVQRGTRAIMDQLFRKFLINELVYDGSTPLIVLPA